MIIFREKQFSNFKTGILELSSSKVKYFEGQGDNIQRFKFDTKTNEGLQGRKLNVEYFKRQVLPVIERILKEHSQSNIYCIATALFRKIDNLQEIQNICPIKINVLSEFEEASGSIEAFLQTTHRNLSGKIIVTMDPGSMSTEVYVKDYGYISLNFGTRVNSQRTSELRKLQKKFGWLQDKNNVIIVVPGFKDEMNDKDLNLQDYPDSVLKNNILGVINALGKHHKIVCSSGNLGIGYYYKMRK